MGPKALQRCLWRNGTKGMLNARFAAVRVRVADGALVSRAQHLPGQAAWLVCEARSSGERKYYSTRHPAGTPRMTLVRAIKARWACELFFLVLKEGCRVERLQLADTERLQTALALYMVIAWRINRLMRLGRTLPDLPADLLFEPDEWRAAFILNKKPVPRQTPTLNTVVRLIAQRGGFLGRKHDGEPGARTIWLGMQEIAVFVEGARYARQFNDG